MCGTCGCSDTQSPPVGTDADRRLIPLEENVLSRNDALAADNRRQLHDDRILAVNLMSSPGSGKTTLLERTIREFDGPVSVIEGDQETRLDADRIRSTGAPVLQINTGTGCHLDAGMISRALRDLAPPSASILFIENVGNLVCPALFDLGERARVVIMSTTEGADKPLKYPQMFSTATLVLLNKTDLLPYLDFDVDEFRADLAAVRPGARVLPVSARTGDGMDAWYGWIRHELAHVTDTAHDHDHPAGQPPNGHHPHQHDHQGLPEPARS